MSHANISIFVPHLGCPCRCSFCSQHHITGTTHQPTQKDISSAVKTAVKSKNYDPKTGEIAFFGGSFTAIEKNYMISLLSAAKKFVDSGVVSGIRISTRPDCIDDEILCVLKNYGVTVIELGAQSTNDEVLAKNKRGHTRKHIFDAAKAVKDAGFTLVLQMMTGLYGSNDEMDTETARDFIDMQPSAVRIYPTVVLKNTELEKLYACGKYIPPDAAMAAILGAKLIMMFENENIPIIRFGLHTIDEDSFVAGAWHPALSQMALSQIYLNAAISALKERPAGKYVLYVPTGETSNMIGQKRCNVYALLKHGYDIKVKEDSSLHKFDVKIQ